MVRIDYDADTDTVFSIIDRVNSSTANAHMYYDPVSDRFVVRNDDVGSVGLTLHESSSDSSPQTKGRQHPRAHGLGGSCGYEHLC